MKVAELGGIELSERGPVGQPDGQEGHANVFGKEDQQAADPPPAAHADPRDRVNRSKESDEHYSESKMQWALTAHAHAVEDEAEAREKEEDSEQEDGDVPWWGHSPEAGRFQIVARS
jgi:hypothetical protein